MPFPSSIDASPIERARSKTSSAAWTIGARLVLATSLFLGGCAAIRGRKAGPGASR